MRFNCLVVVVALQTLVSALPLYSVSTQISQRGTNQIGVRSEPDISADLVTRNDVAQWELSLRKHIPPEIHWGLYLHPAGQSHGGTVCEAVSKPGAVHTAGVSHLITRCFADTRDSSVALTSLGPIGSAAKKDEAVQLLKNVKCETPTEICIDYTLKGATVLHTHKLIGDAGLAKMKKELDENQDGIRKETEVHFTKVIPPKP